MLQKKNNTHEQHGRFKAQLRKTLPELFESQETVHEQIFTGNQKSTTSNKSVRKIRGDEVAQSSQHTPGNLTHQYNTESTKIGIPRRRTQLVVT